MIKIQRKVEGDLQNFDIYTLSEAENLKLNYSHWKEVEVGQYGASDDGYVGLCIHRKGYTDKHERVKTFVKMCYGVQWISKNSKLLFEPNHSLNTYTQVKPENWEEKESRKTRTKNAVTAYAEMLLSENSVDWEKLGNIYRPEQKNPPATVRRLFKQRIIKNMVEQKLKDILHGKGINKEYVLELHEEAIKMAKTSNKPQILLQAADVYMDLLEMKPGKKIITDAIELDMSSKISGVIEKEEKKVKLERKIEEPIKNEE